MEENFDPLINNTQSDAIFEIQPIRSQYMIKLCKSITDSYAMSLVISFLIQHKGISLQ